LSSGPAVAPSAAVVEELLARGGGELTQREEVLTEREEKARISKKALAQDSASLIEEWTKAKAARQEYRKKIAEHTAHGKQVPNFNKMLGKKRARLDEWERDLELRTVALVKAHA
jgi:hypothetical protein